MRHITAKFSELGVDTAAVLFLLAVEMGRAGNFVSLDTGLMGLTLVMVLVLPYFLLSASTEMPLAQWLGVRCAVISFGVALGLVLPASMAYMPTTLLILAAIFSCCVQFYGLMRLRLAD